MAWVKFVCGRLKSDFRYSANIVYNNFPWKELDEEQKIDIERTATEILEARAADASCLASQYDLLKGRLSKAHKENDKVVAKAYGIDLSMSDEDIALELMRRSVKLANKTKKKSKKKRTTKTKKTLRKKQNTDKQKKQVAKKHEIEQELPFNDMNDVTSE
jgi:hypothetical protein